MPNMLSPVWTDIVAIPTIRRAEPTGHGLISKHKKCEIVCYLIDFVLYSTGQLVKNSNIFTFNVSIVSTEELTSSCCDVTRVNKEIVEIREMMVFPEPQDCPESLVGMD